MKSAKHPASRNARISVSHPLSRSSPAPLSSAEFPATYANVRCGRASAVNIAPNRLNHVNPLSSVADSVSCVSCPWCRWNSISPNPRKTLSHSVCTHPGFG